MTTIQSRSTSDGFAANIIWNITSSLERKNMTTANATPKPRAGEYKRWADQYDLDRSDPATRLFIAASNWVDRCEAAEAERDLLRERERELVDVLRELLDVTKRANIEVPMSDAPVFFAARELLAKHGR